MAPTKIANLAIVKIVIYVPQLSVLLNLHVHPACSGSFYFPANAYKHAQIVNLDRHKPKAAKTVPKIAPNAKVQNNAHSAKKTYTLKGASASVLALEVIT